MVNTLIQDDSRTYHGVDCVDDEDTSGEQFCRVEFLSSLPPSGLPSHTLDLKINTIVIFFILQQLKTLQYDKFPIKIAFPMMIRFKGRR
jgi:hypothetical protein